ncbi:MAG: carboxypeptidase PM20D1 [Paraglaciecola sp.]|jgi:carboxypeptidase PM20D1
MKKILMFLIVTIVFLSAVLLLRAQSVFENKQYQVHQPLVPAVLDEDGAIKRFVRAIQIPTISFDDRSQFDHQAFSDFHQHLASAFPLVHQRAVQTKIKQYSLIYHLKGSAPDLKPALFMGHMDVVPVDENTLGQWQYLPFGAEVVDGTIWGRGTIDDKVSVLALMEAMELLLKQGIEPKRSVYFAFGHDEEVLGEGAVAIAEYFSQQKLQFEFVLDEGGVVTEGIIPGASQAVALIGVAEKGFVNFRLRVNGEGGHSSQPPEHSAAGVLAQALVKVENNQFPSTLDYSKQMLDTIAYSMPLSLRLPMANLWLFSPLVESVLLAKPSTAASLRTTTAVTMLQGSNKSNVLPTQASAVVNFRILPGDTIATVQAHLERIIDDPRVQLESFMGTEPSPVSSTSSYGFKLIEQTIRRLDKNVLVAPYLVLGATDARHFYPLSDNVYRFMMVRLTPETLKGFHGINEKIMVKDYLQAIQFYYAMLKQAVEGQSIHQ